MSLSYTCDALIDPLILMLFNSLAVPSCDESRYAVPRSDARSTSIRRFARASDEKRRALSIWRSRFSPFNRRLVSLRSPLAPATALFCSFCGCSSVSMSQASAVVTEPLLTHPSASASPISASDLRRDLERPRCNLVTAASTMTFDLESLPSRQSAVRSRQSRPDRGRNWVGNSH